MQRKNSWIAYYSAYYKSLCDVMGTYEARKSWRDLP